MTTEEKKQVRRKYVLVLIPSLAFLGGTGVVAKSMTTNADKVIEIIDTTRKAVVDINAALKTPGLVNCSQTFEVTPVPVKK